MNRVLVERSLPVITELRNFVGAGLRAGIRASRLEVDDDNAVFVQEVKP